MPFHAEIGSFLPVNFHNVEDYLQGFWKYQTQIYSELLEFPCVSNAVPGLWDSCPPHHEMSSVTDLHQDHLQSLLGVRHRPRHPCSFSFQACFPEENHLFPQNGNSPRKQPRSAKLFLSALPFKLLRTAHFIFMASKTRSQPSIPAAMLATVAKPHPPRGLLRPPRSHPDGFEAVCHDRGHWG